MKFLEGQKEEGPVLLEALGNADVFYEMQYKEVKIVANVSVVMHNDDYIGLGCCLNTPPSLGSDKYLITYLLILLTTY